MFPAVGINIGDLIELEMEKAGVSAPPTFLDLSDFLRADTFLKMPKVWVLNGNAFTSGTYGY